MKIVIKSAGLLVLLVAVVSCHNNKNTQSNNSIEGDKTGTFTDKRDSTEYKWVRIGGQYWMAENLAYKPAEGKYWAYNNDQNNVAKYGYLYDWETAKNVCPSGWHLPSDAEWTTLTDYLGGKEVAGGKLKEAGTKHWHIPNGGATNESGFAARPGGGLNNNGSFNGIGNAAGWWISTEDSTKGAWIRSMNYLFSSVSRSNYDKEYGFSVRCLRD